jgi:capsular polysaccharide transport system ATP-binding protein
VGLSGGLQGSLTGRDSVKFVCRIYGTAHDEMLEKIRFVEAFAEIGDYFDQPVKTYSSGMRARLNFGLSWAFDFDYYLMDEIGAVGDARFKQKSRQLMELRLSQSRVIMVSHAMPEIARLCSVVVLVDDGQAILYEDVGEGIRAYQQMTGIPGPLQRAAAARAGQARLQGAQPGETASPGVAPPRKIPFTTQDN